MTNTSLNLGFEYVTFNYAGGMLQLQSNTSKNFKLFSAEELDIMITWFVGVRQNMEKHEEVTE